MSTGNIDLRIREIIKWKQFKDRVRVDTNHCLTHANKQCALDKEIVLTIHMPHESLRKWGDFRKQISQLMSSGTTCSYIQLLNTFLYTHCGYRVKEKCQRVEKRLEKACSEIRQKFVGKSGAAYRKLCQKDLNLALRLNELVTVGEVDSALATEKLKCAKIEMVNKELDKSLSDAKVADQAKTEELCNARKEVEELTLENKSLKDYVEKLGQDLNFNNGGKKITDVSERQQRRKLSELKTHTEKALWFSKTFGLDIQDVSFVDENGKQHTFSYQSKEKRGYKDLSEEEKQKVKNILFILDKFCIGDASYHELTMLYDGLPRSYLIKQCKDEINKLSHIVRTPGTAPGAQLDFMSELKSVVEGMVS